MLFVCFIFFFPFSNLIIQAFNGCFIVYSVLAYRQSNKRETAFYTVSALAEKGKGKYHFLSWLPGLPWQSLYSRRFRGYADGD